MIGHESGAPGRSTGVSAFPASTIARAKTDMPSTWSQSTGDSCAVGRMEASGGQKTARACSARPPERASQKGGVRLRAIVQNGLCSESAAKRLGEQRESERRHGERLTPHSAYPVRLRR